MKKQWGKILAWMLCAALALTSMPVALAEATTLSVDFRGLNVGSDGQWTTVLLSGTFRVMQGTKEVGTLKANAADNTVLALPSADSVTLLPVMETMPAEYLVQESGYSVSITAGRQNNAPVLVYANSGLFSVLANGAASFELTDADGQVVLTFTTADDGTYTAEAALPVGTYTLRQADAEAWATFELLAYRGSPEQIVTIDMLTPMMATEVPAATAAPATPEATATPVVTETPAVTEAPAATETPVVTDAPVLPAETDTSSDGETGAIPNGGFPPTLSDDETLTLPQAEGVTLSMSDDGASVVLTTDEAWSSETSAVLCLPADWWAIGAEQTEVWHTVLGDMLPMPVDVTEATIPLSAISDTTSATLYVRKEDATQANALADAVLGIYGGVYEAYTVDVQGTITPMTAERIGRSITGTVVDDEHVPAPLATVQLDDSFTHYLTLTDENGNYAFEQIPESTEQYITAMITVESSLTAISAETPVASKKDRQIDLMASEYNLAGALADAAMLMTERTLPNASDEAAMDSVAMPDAAEATEVPADTETPVEAAASTEAAIKEPTETEALAEAEPTAEAEPAEEPVSETLELVDLTTGSLTVEASGAPSAYDFSLMTNGETVAQGTINSGETLHRDGLTAGDYTITITLPDGIVMTALNGYASLQKQQAQWQISVTEGKTGLYRMVFAQAGAISGDVRGIPDGTAVQILGTEDSANTVVSGGKIASGSLLPGDYTVTVVMPNGVALSGDGWTAADADGQTVVTATATVIADTVSTLPALTAEAQAVAEVSATSAKVAEAMGSGSISVNVFLDGNNNGEDGKYERKLANAEVQAIRVTAEGETVMASATSNEEGAALLENLPAGDYKLRVILPANYGFTTHGKAVQISSSIMNEQSEVQQDSELLTLADGQVLEIGVGTRAMSSVTGQAWLDVNADGIKQSDEPGQSGVKVELIGEKNGLTYEVTTGDDGNYALTQVKPGSYKLRFTTPDGLMFTKYSVTGRENRSVITTEGKRTGAKQVDLEGGDVLSLQYVGVIPDAVIEGRCFLDANYNGLYDEGEEALPGVELELLKQLNGKSVATTVSAEDGTFSFVALRANTYRLRVILPNTGVNFTCVVAADVLGNQLKAREGRRENSMEDLVLTTGEVRQVVIGAVMPAAVTGTVYFDNNFSATQDSGEKVVSGLTVTLTDGEGNVVATDKTSVKGKFVFEGLNPGVYGLTMTAKEGYAFTKLGEGNVMLNEGNGVGRSETFTLSLGEEKSGMDCGMILPGLVEGTVFADANDNGLQDEGEIGLTGTVVRLMSDEGEHFSATIDESGAFRFDAVMPGRYYLRYELPEGAVFARTADGGNTISGEDGTGASEWFDFATGDTKAAALAGGLLLGHIDGTCFADHNGSGAMEADESPMSGVTLTLTPTRSDLESITATSDESGAFALANLHPDHYTLTMTFPEGYVLSRLSQATLPVRSGDHQGEYPLTVTMGDTWTAQLLGGVMPASLSGQLWLDENNDGMLTAGEKTPAGEKITVIDEQTGSIFATLTTDEEGRFATEGLVPGSFTLRYALSTSTIAPKSGSSTFIQNGNTLEMSGIAVSEGDERTDPVLGIVRYTTLGGLVWLDEGGNIVPLADASVTLMDASGMLLQTVTTGENGRYTFDKLLPGSYYIGVTLPEGQLVCDADDERVAGGENINVMTQSGGRTGQSGEIIVAMGVNQLKLDIGSVLPGKLGDLCWLDENGNGLQDGGEGGIPGVKIELLRGDTVVAETTSDQYGYYLLDNVYPATYTLRVTPPAEVTATTHRTDIPAICSVLGEGDGEQFLAEGVVVQSDKHNYNADLGFVLKSDGVYPAGYGNGATQDWTKLILGE